MIVTSDDSADAVSSALRKRPGPATFEIDQRDADPKDCPRSYVGLHAAAIYDRDALADAAHGRAAEVEPTRRIQSKADARAAQRELFNSVRKSIDEDGLVAYYTQRPPARVLTRMLLSSAVSPNHISLIAMGLGVAAAVLAGIGTFTLVAVAGFLYWAGAMVDCIDGDLARLRIEGSKMGEWLDTIADDVSTGGLMLGLGIGMYRDGYEPMWLYIAVAAAVIFFVSQTKIYVDLHRLGGTIDTAKYPWFFGTPSEGHSDESDGRGLFGTIFYVGSFIFRRDAFVTIVMVALFLGARRVTVASMAVGIGLVAVLLATHLMVAPRRNESTVSP